jgi:hypothetical protein
MRTVDWPLKLPFSCLLPHNQRPPRERKVCVTSSNHQSTPKPHREPVERGADEEQEEDANSAGNQTGFSDASSRSPANNLNDLQTIVATLFCVPPCATEMGREPIE